MITGRATAGRAWERQAFCPGGVERFAEAAAWSYAASGCLYAEQGECFTDALVEELIGESLVGQGSVVPAGGPRRQIWS